MARLSLIVLFVALKVFPDAGGVLRKPNTPGQRRMHAAVMRRDPKTQLPRRRLPISPQRQRLTMVTKAGATVPAGEPSVTTQRTSIAPPVNGGPPVFTRQIRRTSSTMAGPTTTSSKIAAITSASTFATTPTTTVTSTTVTSSSTTCPACGLSYFAPSPYPATGACTEPCCAAGMICSYQTATIGACFPP